METLLLLLLSLYNTIWGHEQNYAFCSAHRLGHVTPHTSTNLHQSPSTLFTTTTTGIPQHPLASLTFFPLTTTFTMHQDMATMAETQPPQYHITVMHQVHKLTTMG